jgi:hypothetical protein
VSVTRLRAAQPPGDALGRIQWILRRYLSPIMVDSVLEKAMRQREVAPGRTLAPDALAELTGDIMIGLRLFVPAERLPELMLELAEILEGGTE